MQDNSSIAISPGAHHEHPDAVSAECSARRLAFIQFFRPGVLAALALAFAVGGWSYGYKLSRYLDNPNVTKASATRMWVDHRDNSFAVPAQHQHRPEKLLSPQFCGLTIPRLPHLSRELVQAPPVLSHVTTFVSPLHPLRAPPLPIPSLA